MLRFRSLLPSCLLELADTIVATLTTAVIVIVVLALASSIMTSGQSVRIVALVHRRGSSSKCRRYS